MTLEELAYIVMATSDIEDTIIGIQGQDFKNISSEVDSLYEAIATLSEKLETLVGNLSDKEQDELANIIDDLEYSDDYGDDGEYEGQ